MVKWFRFYHDALDDPKVQRLPGDLFKFWVNILCLASQSDDRGLIKQDAFEIAFALRVSDDDAERMLAELIKRNLLDEMAEGYEIHNWSARQFKSDNVAERVQEHRAKQKDAGVTFHETLHVTPTETLKPSVSTDSQITDTESDTEETSDANAPSADSPYALLESLCETQGQDVSVLSKRDKDKQLAVAKRLVADGMTAEDVGRMTRWLMSQTWITGGIDMFVIEARKGKWQLTGKPDAAQGGALTVHQGGRDSPAPRHRKPNGGLTPEGILARREAGHG